MDMKIKAIAPWFGSNRMLASRVGVQLGKLDWCGVSFAGGCAELPHINARSVMLNDLHRHVINMARVMADPKLGPALYRKLRRYILHQDSLIIAQARCEIRENSMKEKCNLVAGKDRELVRSELQAEPDLWWAEDYFVSAWMSRSHSAGSEDEFSSGMSIRWNASGGDSAVRFSNAVRSIPPWRRALKHTSFSTIDALAFHQRCKDEDGHGIYDDPPFPGPGDRYKFKVDENFQRNLAKEASRFKKTRVVMRFYDHPLIRELYPQNHWTWIFDKGRNQVNEETPEVLLVNGRIFRGAA